MRRSSRWKLSAALVAAGMLGIALAQSASALPPVTQPCTGFIGPNITIDQNITVPPGAHCFLEHVTVNGNIAVQGGSPGGELIFMASTMTGNISVEPGGEFNFDCYGSSVTSTVTGNFTASGANEIYAGCGGSLTVTISGNVFIDGTVNQLRNGSNDHLNVGGNLTLTNNQNMQLNHVTVGTSQHKRNLTCFGNTNPGTISGLVTTYLAHVTPGGLSGNPCLP